MFSLQYSAPQPRDPNQRDAYFTGQSTGWDQMAEVARDRNEKRRIELSRQQLDLQRQQEARVARENAMQIQIQREQNAIASQQQPLIEAQKMASLANTQVSTARMLSELQKGPNFANQSFVNQQSILNPPTTRQMAQEQQAYRQTEAPKQRLEDISEPSPGVREIPKAQEVVIEGGLPTAAVNSLFNQIARSGQRDREAEAQSSREAAQKREETMLAAKPYQSSPSISSVRGFGIGNTGGSLSLAGFEDGYDFKQYII